MPKVLTPPPRPSSSGPVHGLLDQRTPLMAVHEAAATYGIPVVRAYDEFSGPDGDLDPVASGDVQGDEKHLTSQGVERFVDLLVGLGLSPIAEATGA